MEGARPAVSADLAELAAMARLAAEELAPARGGSVFLGHEARAEPIEPSFAADLEDPTRRVLVGTVDGVPLGYGVAALHELHDHRRLAVISDLYVVPEAREVGVGEALLDALVGWAAEQGCSGVDSFALPGERTTKNFFEANGFTARLLVVHRALAAPGDQ